MPGTEPLEEAARLMTICNSCRYCEGLCAVFPAMELRRSFEVGDLEYLANLCHGCGACYTDCQFAPPHEFAVNVPKTLARVRADSYRAHAWPARLRPLFDRNGLAVTLIAALSVAAFILGFALWHDPHVLLADTGRFYALMPHRVMAALFSAVGGIALVALVMGVRDFWKHSGAGSASAGSVWRAAKDAASLRYLDGGGAGCVNEDERPTDKRRLFHHFTFYGFLACFAATCTGTVLHYAFDHPAPYAWYELPKLFGIPGGVALLVGTAGLMRSKRTRDPALVDGARAGMDAAFLVMLFLTALTGLALMAARQTPAMGVLLAVHLGVVLALFATMPYGKFVHGLYRFAALVLHALEQRSGSAETAAPLSRGEDDDRG